MIKAYPKFARGELQSKYNSFKKSEKEIIENYITYISGTAGKRRIDENRRTLTQIKVILNKDFNDFTLEDIRDYLAALNHSYRTRSSRNSMKEVLKRFLKWKFKDWSKRFDDLKDIKLKFGINEEKINSDTLLKKEELEQIKKYFTNYFWKTLFITLYESGLRPGELATLKWSNIHFNTEGELSEITIHASKTHRTRSVYVKEATAYLQELKRRQEHNSELVFPSPRTKQPLTRGSFSIWFQRISKLIGRPIHAYILRHTRASELYLNAGIPDKVAQKFMGHSADMSQVYTHMSNKDVKEAVLKSVYKFEDLPKEKQHKLEQEVEKLKQALKDQTEYFNMELKNISDSIKTRLKTQPLT